jgi:hypothetical protein
MSINHVARTMITNQAEHVRAINRRYSKPRMTMSPGVRWALLSLRLYLLTLVGLLAYKFIMVVTQ